jgi:hypothetical protein
VSIQRLLILESADCEKPAGYDHVVSFSPSGGDTYPHAYVSPGEIASLEGEMFERFLPFLEGEIDHSRWEYRGVHLLRCFKKKFFNLLSFTSARLLVLRRIQERFSEGKIYIEYHADHWEAPYLSALVRLLPQRDQSRLVFCKIAGAVLPFSKFNSFRLPRWWVERWPSQIRWGHWRNAQICFFADYKKSRAVIEAAGAQKALELW